MMKILNRNETKKDFDFNPVLGCTLYFIQLSNPFIAYKLPMEFRLDHENKMRNKTLNTQDIFSVRE